MGTMHFLQDSQSILSARVYCRLGLDLHCEVIGAQSLAVLLLRRFNRRFSARSSYTAY